MLKPLLVVVVFCSLLACDESKSPTSPVAPTPAPSALGMAGTWAFYPNPSCDGPAGLYGSITFTQTGNSFSGTLASGWIFTGTVTGNSVQGSLTAPPDMPGNSGITFAGSGTNTQVAVTFSEPGGLSWGCGTATTGTFVK